MAHIHMFNNLAKRLGIPSAGYTNISESSRHGQSGHDPKKFEVKTYSYEERDFLRGESNRIRDKIAAMEKTLINIGSVGNSSQIPSKLSGSRSDKIYAMETLLDYIGRVNSSRIASRLSDLRIASQLSSSQIASELKMLPLYIERTYGMTELTQFSKDNKVTTKEQGDLNQSLKRRIEDLYYYAKMLKISTGNESYDISKIAQSAFDKPDPRISNFLILSNAIKNLETAYSDKLKEETLTKNVLNKVKESFDALKSNATELSSNVYYAGRDVVKQFQAPDRDELQALKKKFNVFGEKLDKQLEKVKLDEQLEKVTPNKPSAAGEQFKNFKVTEGDRDLGRGQGR
jgi:hypothetical protein